MTTRSARWQTLAGGALDLQFAGLGAIRRGEGPMSGAELHPARARYWIERWDPQQEHHMPDREARFELLADVLTELLARPAPLIVDLGAGPGTLSDRSSVLAANATFA